MASTQNVQGETFATCRRTFHTINLSPPGRQLQPSIPLILPSNYEYDPIKNTAVKKQGHDGIVELEIVQESGAVELLKTNKVLLSKPLAVLSTYRSGKSYFLSRMLDIRSVSKRCDISGVFKTNDTMNPCTRGIWMATTALECDEFIVLLLDTEGTDDASSDGNNIMTSHLLVVTTLLSSCLIYNSEGVPDKGDLQEMSCFTELSSRIVTQDEAIGNRSSDELYFPNLVWLIRDFDLVTKDEHGNPITPTEYIRTQILTPSEESEASSSEDVARAILSLFPLVECRTIPHPGSDPAAATIQLEGLADFNEKVEEVGDFLLSTIERKRGFRDGDNVNGPTLAALTEEYVRALNSPDCSVNLESSWIKARITALLHKLVSEYEQDMEKAVESVLPMPEGHLNDALPPVKATASAQQELGVSEDEQQQQELPGLDDPASTQGAARSAIGVSLAPEFVEALLRKFVSEFEQDMKKAVESVLPMPEGDLNDALAPVKATASVQQELEESKDEQQQQEQPGLDEPGLDDPASTQEAANKTETSEKSLQCITNECPLPKEDSEVNEQQPLLPFPLIGGGIRIDLNTPSSVQGEDTEYQHRIEVRSTTSINLSPEYAIPVEVVVTVPVIVPPPPPLRNEDNTPKTLMSIHCSILKQKLEILQRELDSLMPVPNSNTKERRDEVIDNIMQQIVECKISGEVDSGMLKKFVRNNRIKSRENCEKIFNKVFQPLKDNFSRRNEMIGVTNYYRAAVGPAKSLVFLKKKRELVKYASTLIPSKPENIRVIGRGHNRIKIRWDEPLIRPMAAKRYCVQKRKENDSAWLEVTLTSGFSALITGLESDTKYRFRVHGIAGKSTSESAEVKTETKYQPAVQKTLSVASGLAGGTIGAPVVAAHAGVIVAQYGWKNRDMGAVCLGVTSVAISPLALLSGYITGPHVARMTALKLGEEGDLSYPNPDSKSETDSDPPTDITDSDIDFYN